MIDQSLIAFFHRAQEVREEQLERLVPPIAAAAEACADCLINSGKLLLAGDRENRHIGSIFAALLTDHYLIDRPSLPCIELETGFIASGESYAARQLRALSNAEDCLVLFTATSLSDQMKTLLSIGRSRGLKSIVIGGNQPDLDPFTLSHDDISIMIETQSKSGLLDSQMAIALAIAGLIDLQIFGSKL